jgi:hypothetical protein
MANMRLARRGPIGDNCFAAALTAAPVSVAPAGPLMPNGPPMLAPVLPSRWGHFWKYGHLTDGSAYGVKRICASTLEWICDLLTGPKILESRLLPRLSPATKYIPSGSTICLKSPQS